MWASKTSVVKGVRVEYFGFLKIYFRKKEEQRNICLLFHLRVCSLVDSLYVPWPGIEPSTLAHPDDAPASWAPGQKLAFLSPSLCPHLLFICCLRKGDVALLSCTAIVNTSNENLTDKNPVSESIFMLAGPDLKEELQKLKGKWDFSGVYCLGNICFDTKRSIFCTLCEKIMEM